MFEALKKKLSKQEGEALYAPIAGQEIPIQEAKDPTFAEELLGKAIAIIPTENKIVSPVDGTVGSVFETKHAITINTKEGGEVLIHVGIDTVQLKGQFYSTFVEDGAKIKKGDLLIEFDKAKVMEAGYDPTVFMVICNTDDYKEIKKPDNQMVTNQEVVVQLVR
ncbi:MAG: PTS glucose transporter subunit IIA [Lachnospiraceae bacterium]|nr:PTS glucose transporter subunit IIA [Lachnospiraceae bacterium]